MDTVEATPRTRLVVIDGDRRFELALTPDTVIADALAGLGLAMMADRRVLIGRNGREVDASVRADALTDGAVLALVDLTEAPLLFDPTQAPSDTNERISSGAVWWMLAAAAILLAVLGLLPEIIGPPIRVALVVTAGIGAVASATVWALRERADRLRATAAASAPLLLAFAAGVAAIPPLPASTGILAIFTGLCAAAVVSAVLSVIARAGVVRAELGTVTLILLGLAMVWGLALVLGVDVVAPTAISLGAVPVALRALPSTLLDVPPGMFIEYRRFQTARWAVRQQVPPDGGPIGAGAARDLVGRSSARLFAGTALLSAVAAVCAPSAIPSFDGSDPLVLSGRIALATCTVLALLLGARRMSPGALRWMPRAAALVVAVIALLAAIRVAADLWLTVFAAVALVIGVAIALAIVPVGRGARSLFWSRFGDALEWIAVVLALPAALLAADSIDLLRGMMGA